MARWTPEATGMLREAYADAATRQMLSARLDVLQRRLGVSRGSIIDQAKREGLTFGSRRPWRAGEDEYLQDNAGTVSVRSMARKLGRSRNAVEGRIKRLRLSRRLAYGYNMVELATVFGVSEPKVARWMERGLFGQVHRMQGASGGHRVKEANVMTFIRQWPHEYDLRRVDQLWYKSMIFGGAQ